MHSLLLIFLLISVRSCIKLPSLSFLLLIEICKEIPISHVVTLKLKQTNELVVVNQEGVLETDNDLPNNKAEQRQFNDLCNQPDLSPKTKLDTKALVEQGNVSTQIHFRSSISCREYHA
jgi:hypothetical protein